MFGAVPPGMIVAPAGAVVSKGPDGGQHGADETDGAGRQQFRELVKQPTVQTAMTAAAMDRVRIMVWVSD